jgi:nucleotide-binding universal stress UspA family protein
MGANRAQERPRYVLVVATDFSSAAESALEEAVRIAKRVDRAEIHLLHVVTSHAPPPDVAACVSHDLAQLNEIDQASIELQRVIERVKAGRTCVGGHVRVGRPDREIARLAADLGADMIVVGTDGRRSLDRWIFGSIAERLLRRVPCEVLVHRPSQMSGRAEHPPRGRTYYEIARSATARP